jgi:hypothetical protein
MSVLICVMVVRPADRAKNAPGLPLESAANAERRRFFTRTGVPRSRMLRAIEGDA